MTYQEYQQAAEIIIHLCSLSGLTWYIKLPDGRYLKIVDIDKNAI